MHIQLKEQLKQLNINFDVDCIKPKQFHKLMKVISKTYKKKEKYENKLQSDARLIHTVFQEATEGIIIEDKDRNIIHANASMARILGTSPDDLLGKHSDYLSDMIPLPIKEKIYKAMTTQGFWQGEVKITPPNKKEVYSWLTLDALFDERGEMNNIVIMITDISEIHVSRKKMDYLASYDTLTGLPNRALLFKKLEQSIHSMEKNEEHGMLLFIDIDYFKEFNDRYGHQIGDKVLQTVAEEVTSICRTEDILGRLSGDEFLLISENVNNKEAIDSIIEKIQNIFRKPHKIDNLSLHISVSIGVALYPENGNTPEALINAADQAMYSVKKTSRNHYAFFTQKMADLANEYSFIHNALKDAIQSENFRLVYQPQYLLDTHNSLVGIEVLLRCTHSRISHIPIARLITIAEETGIIRDISRLVLEMVCKQINIWNRQNLRIPRIAINLSRKELHEESLVVTIHSALSKYKIDPKLIEIEITESALLNEHIIVKENIERLQKLGHTFSIDDYGTGFSSLSNIKTFHFDKLKIDKSFIDNLHSDKDDQVIVSATISMAKKLGLHIIAEGVETKEQETLLKEFGCDMVQGFLYSKPLSREAMEKLLTSKK
jgi:diguanylate cyclase (GGDEF)-like protein/PAS domain S-box-containing protein